MSLLDQLTGTLGDQGADWLADLLGRAGTLADEQLPPGEAVLVRGGLSLLEGHADELAHLGAAGLVSLVARYSVGQMTEAELGYLASSATFEERRAASHASTGGTLEAAHARELAWEAVKETLQEVGMVALRILPLLLAA